MGEKDIVEETHVPLSEITLVLHAVLEADLERGFWEDMTRRLGEDMTVKCNVLFVK